MTTAVGFVADDWNQRVDANLRLLNAGMGRLPEWFHPDRPPDAFEEYKVWREYKDDLDTLFKSEIKGVFDKNYPPLPAEQIRSAMSRGWDDFYANRYEKEAKEKPKPKLDRPGRAWLRDLGRIAPTDIPADMEAPPPERAPLLPLVSLVSRKMLPEGK